MFFDDTIMSEVRSIICQAYDKRVLTTSVFLGNIDIVKEPISIKQFEKASSLKFKKIWDLSPTLGQLQPPTNTTIYPTSWIY